MLKDAVGPPLVVDPAFSFEASVRQSIRNERLDAGLDVGPAGALSSDARRRAYDLAFGPSPLTSPSISTSSSQMPSCCPSPHPPDSTLSAFQPYSPPSTCPLPFSDTSFSSLLMTNSPLTSLSTSPSSSQRPSRCPSPRAREPTSPAIETRFPLSARPTPSSDASFSNLALEREKSRTYGPLQASRPTQPTAAKTRTRSRKRKRASQSSSEPRKVNEPPASLPSTSTAARLTLNTNAPACPPPNPALTRKRKRASQSSSAPRKVNEPPASLPSTSTAARLTLNTNAPACPPPNPALTSHAQLPPPTMALESGSKRPSKVLRDKNKGRAHRRKVRQEARLEDPRAGRAPRLTTVLKHIAPAEVTRTKMDISNIPSASTGFVALPDRKGRVYTLQELVDVHKFKIIKWDGRMSRAIVDSNDLVIAVLAGQRKTSSWASACEDAFQAMQDGAQQCKFAKDDRDHRRGNFAVLSAGISFGGGAMLPGNLYHGRTNATQLNKLLSHPALIRLAGFQSGVFKAWAPNLYAYYETHFDDLLEHHPKLRRNFTNSVWAACAMNFGPRTITAKHRDFHNLPFGLCAITALGHFDPTKGGHIVMWELKLVIEFPPGSTILLPSAVVAHSNTPIGRDEVRASFTQYSAGGLFRWTEHGFQLEPDFEATLSAEQEEEVELQNAERCKLGLSLFSTLTELQML